VTCNRFKIAFIYCTSPSASSSVTVHPTLQSHLRPSVRYHILDHSIGLPVCQVVNRFAASFNHRYTIPPSTVELFQLWTAALEQSSVGAWKWRQVRLCWPFASGWRLKTFLCAVSPGHSTPSTVIFSRLFYLLHAVVVYAVFCCLGHFKHFRLIDWA